MAREPDPDFVRTLQARADTVRRTVTLSNVIGRAVKLTRSGAEWDGLCPFHADTRVGSFKVNDSKALFKCFSCGAKGDVLDFVQQHKGLTFMDALKLLEGEHGLSHVDWSSPAVRKEAEEARAKREADAEADTLRKRKNGAALYLGGVPIDRTPADAYLRGRALAPVGEQWSRSLVYRPDVWCHARSKAQNGRKFPALIAGVWSLSGELLGCHRHFLNIDQWDHATKSGPVTGELSLGKERKQTLGPSRGGYIPINKGRHKAALAKIPEGTDIYMSEGLEDGLSVAQGLPEARVIAGVSLSKMAHVELPPQMGALVMIAQRDPEGSAAAGVFESVVAAHQHAGRRVKILWPPAGFKDWNDYLMGKPMKRPTQEEGAQDGG